MHRPRLCGLVVVGLIFLPALLWAQERRAVTLGSGESPVSVFADRIESAERDKLLIAEGRVEIQQNEIRLEADRVEINTETGEAVATGRVVLFDGRDRIIGQRLEYSFRSGTGIIYRAEGSVEPHFFFGAERMERFGEKAYRIARGIFTTCEDEAPAWSVRLGSATAYLDDWVWGTNASFWVWKVPLVPFIPVFGASLRRDRHTGFLTPTFSNSSEKGFSVAQPFYWAISDSQDLTLVPTYFTERGFGLGAAYRYVRREGSRGELEGFGLYDTEQDKLRGVVGFRHEEQITPRLTLKADLAWVSDRTYFSEFGDSLDERSRQRLESNLSLTQRWDTWNLVARLYAYQDLTTPEAIELNRLPEIRLNAFQQPVPGLPGLLYELDSSYNYFVRDVGSGGQRLDLRPRLTYPWSPGGLFTLTPRIGLRETLYDTRVTGAAIEKGFVVEATEGDLVSRTLLDATLDWEARAYRVFEVGGLLGIQRLQHAIEPRVSYTALAGNDPDDLPQWDSIDTIRPGQFVTYSLTNRLKARAVGQGDQPGRVWEAARLTFSQTYQIDPDATRTSSAGTVAPADPSSLGPIVSTGSVAKRLSDLFGDLILEPLYGIRFRATAGFDPYETRIRSATTDLIYESPRLRLAAGTRHGQSGRLQFVQGSAEARIGNRWTVRFASNYDVEGQAVIENRFEVAFREQCWAITAAFIDRATEDEFHISINLLELGQYGFGRAFASFQ